MGFSNNSNDASALEQIIAQNHVKCNFTIEQQGEWLTILNKTIPTIMLGIGPQYANYYLTPPMVEEAGNMLNAVGRVAFFIAHTLSTTQIEKALQTNSAENLVRTYCILDEYEKMLKEPHRNHIKVNKDYVCKVLSQMNSGNSTPNKQDDVLYWAPAIYDGDPLTLSEPDYEIHIFPKAAQMISNGAMLQADSELSDKYTFAQNVSGKILHLRTVRNPQLGVEMIPLFTDPNLLLQLYSPNTRISIIDYKTAKIFCLRDKNTCSGIVINPGRDNKMISISQLEQEG